MKGAGYRGCGGPFPRVEGRSRGRPRVSGEVSAKGKGYRESKRRGAEGRVNRAQGTRATAWIQNILQRFLF